MLSCFVLGWVRMSCINFHSDRLGSIEVGWIKLGGVGFY
jgi:hypothetical protein